MLIAACCIYAKGDDGDLIGQKFNFYVKFLNAQSEEQINECLSITDDWDAFEKMRTVNFFELCLNAYTNQENNNNVIEWVANEENKNDKIERTALVSKFILIVNHFWDIKIPAISSDMDKNIIEVILSNAKNANGHAFFEAWQNDTNNISNPTPSKESITLEQQKQIMENLLLWHCEHDERCDRVIKQLSELPEKQRRKMLLWMASKLTDLRFSPCLGEPVPANQHDFLLVGGKCAFILERLLNTKIAPINKLVPPEQILREQKRITELIKQYTPEK